MARAAGLGMVGATPARSTTLTCGSRALGSSLLVLALSCAQGARANGRFPRAERLIEDPSEPSHLLLAATYGLLSTQDRGKTWFHVCEAAFAEPGVQTDPVLALLPDGAVLTSVFSHLSRSSDGGCDFRRHLGKDPTEAVPDFTLDAQGAVIAALVTTQAGQSSNQLQESTDGGRHFHPLGPALPDSVRLVATVDVAPSDSKRVYVSGLGLGGVGVLLRSDDRGESFTSLALPTDAKSDETPYIAAVDPQNADALYVRTDAWKYDELEGVAYANDALLYSNDGGKSFTELLRGAGKLFGFALSPDGSELLVGYGDPVEGGGRVTDPDALGIYRAPAGTSAFERVVTGPVSCLSWTAQGVYACTSQADLGFALGFAAPGDLKVEAPAPFAPLLSLMDVKGPLDCEACASGARCNELWQATCESWGRSDCAAAPAAGGAGECIALGGAGGADDAASGSGGTGSTPLGVGGGGADATTPQGGVAGSDRAAAGRAAGDSGCGCRASRAATAGTFWSAGLILLALARKRRKSLLLLSLLALAGCADKAADPRTSTDDGSECAGDYDTFEPGMTKQATPGAITVELKAAEPSPPVVRRDNVWRLSLSDSDGQALVGATVVASPYMPKHQHGSAEVVVQDEGDGDYTLSPIELMMPGVWEIPMSVTPAGGEPSQTTFRFCIAEL